MHFGRKELAAFNLLSGQMIMTVLSYWYLATEHTAMQKMKKNVELQRVIESAMSLLLLLLLLFISARRFFSKCLTNSICGSIWPGMFSFLVQSDSLLV